MSETKKGVIQSVFGPNDFGFFKVKVDGDWYGAGKSKPDVAKGDSVSFEFYKKDDKYLTIKGKITKTGSAPASSGGSSGPSSNLSKEEWAEKDKRSFRSYAFRDAIAFVATAQAAGALEFLAKAKPADKLDLLTKLLTDVADKMVTFVYADSKAAAKPAPSEAEQEQAGGEDEEAME